MSVEYTQRDVDLMKQASLLCDKATCGYKTACLITKDDEVVVEAFNERLAGNIFCNHGTCIREEENLSGGKNIDKVCSIHAELNAISKSAQQGIALAGTTMYVTTYPCLICAKAIAQAGIKNLYYMMPYMGENFSAPILEQNAIKVINIPWEIYWGEHSGN